MESFFLILGLSLLWAVIAPFFGVLAYRRANRLQHDIEEVRSELDRLRGTMPSRSGRTAVPPTQSAEVGATTAPPEREVALSGQSNRRADGPATAQSKTPQPRKTRDWERLIAANWMVWAGGLALACGGLFLVRIAIDSGFFGPLQRTIAAGLLGAGLILAGFRAQRIETIEKAENAVRLIPQLLAGAGLISLFGAAIACGLIYQFVPPLVAFILLVAICCGSVMLSLHFGSVLAVPGLVGAYAAPLFTGAEGGSVLPLLPYFAAVTGAGLAIIRFAGWRWFSWILISGAGLWGLVASGSDAPLADISGVAYALAIGILGLLFGEADAKHPLALPRNGINLRYIAAGFGSSQFAAHLFWVLCGGLIMILGLQMTPGPIVSGGLAVFGGLSLFSAWYRSGYALLAPVAASMTLLGLTLWAIDAPPLSYACLATGLGFGVGGAVLMQNQAFKTPLAMCGALVPPVALFIAFWRDGGLQPHFAWGMAALLVALLLGTVLQHLAREDAQFAKHPGAGATYGLGVLLSLVLGPFLVFSGFWLGTSMAIVALLVAIILRRFDLPLLRLSAMAVVALSIGLLVRPGLVDPGSVSDRIIFNGMTLGFVVAIAALFGGARLSAEKDTVRQAFEAGALIISFTLIALTIRHIAGEGQLDGPYAGLGEASAYAIAYLGMATSFVWRLSDKAWFFKIAEYIAAAVGLLGVIAAYSDIGYGSVGELPVLNLLFVSFAMPALILAAYGAGLRQAARSFEGTAASVAAMALGFLWITLEVARTFGGQDMGQFYGDFGWAYSPAWIVYAFGLLFWGVLRRRRAPRYASLAILLLSIAKVFLMDMAVLQGAARAGSFIGLGLALIGIALFYQRYVFDPRDTTPAEG